LQHNFGTAEKWKEPILSHSLNELHFLNQQAYDLNLTSVLERMGTSDEITVNTMGEISFLTCIVTAMMSNSIQCVTLKYELTILVSKPFIYQINIDKRDTSLSRQNGNHTNIPKHGLD
jgi:hypothetical protein